MLRVFEHDLACVQLRCRLLPHYLKSFLVFGWGFGLSEGGPLPSGVGGVSSKQQSCSLLFVPSIPVLGTLKWGPGEVAILIFETLMAIVEARTPAP